MFVELVVVAILVVFSFDFFNGFHDAANAIATVVATKVLTPTKAVGLAAVGNFVGMAFITNAIAETIGKGIIDPSVLGVGSVPSSDAQFLHTLAIIMGGVLGAIAWDLLTWLWGLPTSSSHALIGGLVGSAILAGGVQAILFPSAGNMLLFLELTFIAFAAGAVAVLLWGLALEDSPTLGIVILAGLVSGLFPAIILARILLKASFRSSSTWSPRRLSGSYLRSDLRSS